jgi:hypothetical protein
MLSLAKIMMVEDFVGEDGLGWSYQSTSQAE